ncbi:MAG: GNAT family N-acetyltransferase [bacterium]|nr:GNAT family N-acetyltransferase [bacterium]
MSTDPPKPHDIRIRPMRAANLDEGMRLCSLAGWNQLPGDWALFHRANPGGCFVADYDGRVVGTVTTIDYEGKVSWIAMVLVDPDMRRMGIGSRLMRAAIDALSHCQSIKLDATPDGKSVYDKLGFVDEYAFSRMTTPAAPSGCASERVRPVTAGDIDSIIALDARAFGVPRPAVIRGFIDMAPEYAWLAETERGEIAGFALGRHGAQFEHIGPIQAHDIDTAKALCSALCTRIGGKPASIDVLEHAPPWLEWLQAEGFTQQRSFVRMYLGSNGFPGCPDLAWAISGPELG